MILLITYYSLILIPSSPLCFCWPAACWPACPPPDLGRWSSGCALQTSTPSTWSSASQSPRTGARSSPTPTPPQTPRRTRKIEINPSLDISAEYWPAVFITVDCGLWGFTVQFSLCVLSVGKLQHPQTGYNDSTILQLNCAVCNVHYTSIKINK